MAVNQSIFNEFLALSTQERINVCKNAAGEICEYLDKEGYLKEQDFALSFFTSLIGFFIGADGSVTPNETKIFNEIFGTNYSPQDLVNYLPKLMTSDNFMALDDFIDRIDEEQKKFCCYIILAIITADGEVSQREFDLLERILA